VPNNPEIVSFSLDGFSYEIMLPQVRADGLRDLLAPYVQVGRPSGEPVSDPGQDDGPSDRPAANRGRRHRVWAESQAIRRWARERGMSVTSRGRIPDQIKRAYHAQACPNRKVAP
jgi:hypothetical protein